MAFSADCLIDDVAAKALDKEVLIRVPGITRDGNLGTHRSNDNIEVVCTVAPRIIKDIILLLSHLDETVSYPHILMFNMPSI